MQENQLDKSSSLFYEQVKLLYGAIPNSLLANLVGSFIALLVYTGEVPSLRLLIWVGLLLTVTVVQYLNYHNFSRQTPKQAEIRLWYQRFMLASGLFALAVGSAGYFLLVFDSISLQVTLALMIVCLASFATTMFSPRLEIVLPFLFIVFVPVLVMLFLLGTEVTRYVFWMLLVLLILLCMSAYRINRTITRIFELTIEAEGREEILRNSQQRLSLYVKETPLAVIEWNLNHEVLAWNPSAELIFGYKAEEAIGKTATELIITASDRAAASEAWQALTENIGGFHVINENRRRDGTSLFCEWFNTPLINNYGKVIGVMSLVQDISLEIENEKLKKEFVSIVSHELRTPVTSIKGSLALLASGVLKSDEEKTQQMLDMALLNTDRLQLLLNDILDVEKLDSGKVDYHYKECDLGKLLQDVVAANQTYAEKYRIPVRIDETPENCLVKIDPNRIVQVLTNILSNAIKFSANEREVVLSIEQRDKDLYRIKVNNQGDIIPESDRKKMFSKFYQRDSSDNRAKDGSGLGLYICQKILEKHGSVLDFSSTKAKGTTFFFDLKKFSGEDSNQTASQ